MSKEDNGGPAFPCHQDSINQNAPSLGMTLRDYFAAKAMQALIACVWERSGDCNHIIDNEGRVSLHLRAYEHADAMLEVRSK